MLSWSLGPILIAFLMGASGYSSELTSKRAVFLLTRPITWRSILASKLIVNTCVLLAASILASIVYLLTCPAAYTGLLTTPRLAEGVFFAVLFTGISFLTGFACSSVFEGTIESAAFMIVQGTVLICVFWTLGEMSDGLRLWILQLLWPLPLIIAGISVARAGISLPVNERLRRYAITAFAGIATLAIMACLTPRSLINNLIRDRLSCEHIDWSISPDGRYALGRDMRNIYWLDIENDKSAKLEYVYEDYSAHRVLVETIGWMSPHTAYRIGYNSDNWFIRIYDQSDSGVRYRDVLMGRLTDKEGYPNTFSASPHGRLAAVSLSADANTNAPQAILFVDIAKRHKLHLRTSKPTSNVMWWNSPTEFNFIDAQGTAKTIDLTH
ncbi:MAG: hypothetical protein ABFD46_11495 [Armatimonadota bacterium]